MLQRSRFAGGIGPTSLLGGPSETLSPTYKTYAPAVPEPSSVLLVGLGLAGTGLAGKRRRSS